MFMIEHLKNEALISTMLEGNGQKIKKLLIM